ncbi:MAG: helix-turn-helix domain-containing protein [Lysinibacillus sp.]
MKNIKILPKWSIDFRTYCTRNGLTAEDVQKKTGINPTSSSHYRTEKKRLSLKFCKKIKEGIGFFFG